jgi:glycogen synthase
MKVRSRTSSVVSGVSTPGGGAFRSLSEADLRKADTALSHVQADETVAVAAADADAKVNGVH